MFNVNEDYIENKEYWDKYNPIIKVRKLVTNNISRETFMHYRNWDPQNQPRQFQKQIEVLDQ